METFAQHNIQTPYIPLSMDEFSINSNVNYEVFAYLENNKAAFSLFDFARQEVKGKKLLPNLEKEIIHHTDGRITDTKNPILSKNR